MSYVTEVGCYSRVWLRESINYKACASFYTGIPPVIMPLLGLLSVENFSETKLGYRPGGMENKKTPALTGGE